MDDDSDCDMVSAVSDVSSDSEQDDNPLSKVIQMLEKYNFKDNPEAVGVITETIAGVIRDNESDTELILKSTEILSDMASPEHGPPHWRCALVFRALLPVILMDNYPKEKTVAAPTASMRSAKDIILRWIIAFVKEHPALLCRRLVEKDVEEDGGDDEEGEEETPSGSEDEADEGRGSRDQRQRKRRRQDGEGGKRRRGVAAADDESSDSDEEPGSGEPVRRRGKRGPAQDDDDSENEDGNRGGRKKEVMMDPVMGLIQRICTLCPEKKDWREAAAVTIVTLLESFAEQVVELDLDEGTLTSRFASFVELLLTTNRAGFRAFAIDVVSVLVMRAEKVQLEKETGRILLEGVLGCVLDPVSSVRSKAILGVGNLLKALVMGADDMM
ncbi:hypothetical protein FOL47_007163, partial [Perkinsus chesapeaki]